MNMKTAPGPIGRYDNGDNRTYIDPANPEVVLDSVTKVNSATEEKAQLQKWVAKLTAEFAIDQMDYLQTLKAEGSIRNDLVDFVKTEAKRLKDLASEMGTYQHDVLEALLLDLPIPSIPNHLVDIDLDGERVDLDEISDGLLNFYTDHDVDPELAEATVANPVLGYAGTLDLVATLPHLKLPGSDKVGLRGLFDLKCGKNLYSAMRKQLAAYERCTEVWVDHLGNKVAMPEVDFCAVVHLRKDYDRGYKLIMVPTGDVEFQRFMNAYRTYRDQVEAGQKLGGTVLYVPLPDGSQPPPLLEDLSGSFGRSALIKAGLRSITDLAALTPAEALAIKGVAAKTLTACEALLAVHGLTFSTAKAA